MTTTGPLGVNVPLLIKTLEHIEAHPEEWQQRYWRCESGMCFAGTAVDLAGARWLHPATSHVLDAMKVEFNGRDGSCRDVAEDELGITYEDGNHLFEGNNSLDDLRVHVAALCGDPIPTHLARPEVDGAS